MKKQTVFAGMFLLTVGLSAQEVISTQGDSYSNTNNTIDFTIGEPVIETVSDGVNDLTQGFHQTKLTIVSVEDLDVNFTVNIFPNPAADMVNVNIDEFEGISFHLYDVAGKLLKEDKLSAKKTSINVADYSKGTYLLTLTEAENKKTKTYKIIKN